LLSDHLITSRDFDRPQFDNNVFGLIVDKAGPVRRCRTIWKDLEVQSRLTYDVQLAHVRPQPHVPDVRQLWL
jgi:hypothetical protein